MAHDGGGESFQAMAEAVFDELFSNTMGDEQLGAGQAAMAEPVGTGPAACSDAVDHDDGDEDGEEESCSGPRSEIAYSSTHPPDATIRPPATVKAELSPPAFAGLLAATAAQEPPASAPSAPNRSSQAGEEPTRPADVRSASSCSARPNVRHSVVKAKSAGALRRVSAARDDPDNADELDNLPPEVGNLWDDNMAFQPMSAEVSFPSGQIFAAIERSKGTINKYCRRMCVVDWFRRAVPATITSLEGRWAARDHKMTSQFHIDVQVAYWQLLKRVLAILAAHKSLKDFINTATPKHLLTFAAATRTIDQYLSHIRMEFAPDLQVIRSHAIFYETFEAQQNSFSKAFAQLSKADLSRWLASFAEEMKKLPPLPVVKEEVGEEDSDLADGGSGKRTTSKANKGKRSEEEVAAPAPKKKPKSDHPLVSNRFDFNKSAAYIGANLAAEGVKTFVYRITKDDIIKDEVIENFVNQVDELAATWEASWLPVELELEGFAPVLRALGLVLLCAYPDEAKKPATDKVRRALRILEQECRSIGPTSELAEATKAYGPLRVAMEAARKHSAQGLEDRAALAAFSAAAERFEQDFELAFENLELWSTDLSGDTTLQSRKVQMGSLKTMLATLAAITDRLSATTLHEQLPSIGDSIGNVTAIVASSIWSYLNEFLSKFHVAFGNISDIRVPCAIGGCLC